MIKFINILKELGEISVTPYEYDYDKSKHKAFFTTEDGTKYVVYFDISKGEMKVDFGVLYEEDDEDDDNQLPTSLNSRIFIPRHEYHRVIKGTGTLRLKIHKV